VLLFDIPARRNKHREQRIGWTSEQLASRLQHVANNSRFLIVPAFAGVKNLASKVLSLATARLSNDWLKHYGVPLLIFRRDRTRRLSYLGILLRYTRPA